MKIKKKLYLPIYLTDTVLKFYENFESNNSKATWKIIEMAIHLEFQSTAQNHMLRIMIETRKQLLDEFVASYINDTENVYKRVDSKMSQS